MARLDVAVAVIASEATRSRGTQDALVPWIASSLRSSQ
jgi:hypothetical protein